MIFTLSDEKLYIERFTFTIFDALSKTGGIMGIIIGFFQFFIFAVEDTMMYSEIIAKIFKSHSSVYTYS